MHEKKNEEEEDEKKIWRRVAHWLLVATYTSWKMSALLTSRVVLPSERQCEIKCAFYVYVLPYEARRWAHIMYDSCLTLFERLGVFFSVMLPLPPPLLLLLSIRLLLHFLPRVAHDKRNGEEDRKITQKYFANIYFRVPICTSQKCLAEEQKKPCTNICLFICFSIARSRTHSSMSALETHRDIRVCVCSPKKAKKTSRVLLHVNSECRQQHLVILRPSGFLKCTQGSHYP